MLLNKKKLNPILSNPQLLSMIVTLFIFSISFFAIASLSNLETLQVERAGLTLHPIPATNSIVLSEIEVNSKIEVIKEKDGWIQARYQGKVEGWLPKWLIENNQLTNDQNLFAHFQQATTLFQTPSNDGSIIAHVPFDSMIPINYVEKSWAQVNYQGKPAYVQISQIKLLDRQEGEALLLQREKVQKESRENDPLSKDLENILLMRHKEGYLLEEPNSSARILYQTEFLQEFTAVDFIEYSPQESYYLVEDAQGTRGYINSFSLSEPKYSINHRSLPLQRNLSKARIMLDPGHGGEDPGTISTDQQYFEKDFTIKVAKTLQETLQAFGAEVILTNDQDQSLSLTDRAQLSNETQPDLFLSLHFDASTDTTLNGVHTYFYHLEDEEFARTIQNALRNTNRPDMGVEYGNFQVLRENKVPALLLELGYITNPEDLKLMLTDDYHQVLADAITDGLVNYFDQVQNQDQIKSSYE